MRLFAFVLVVPILLLAGCGGGDDEAADGETAAGGGTQAVQVSATEFAFDPNEITLEAGSASFELTNDGSAPHALEIEGGGVEEASDTIDGGESTKLELELADGTYEIYCPVGDHRDRGLKGTLTVGAGGATPTEDDSSDDGAGGY